MPQDLTQNMVVDSQALRQVVQDLYQAAQNSVSESAHSAAGPWFSWINAHPALTAGLIAFLGLLFILLVRELICSYLKTNEILVRLSRLEKKLQNKES